MMSFSYQARDSAGKITKGDIDALNQENAISSLMARGLMVVSIQQRHGGRTTRGSGTVRETDLVLFARQLATMVDAGIPLVSALTALYEQTDPRRQKSLRNVIGEVTSRVQSGESFHEALARQPRVFSRLFVSMVKAGETGGLLAEILDRLAGFLEATARLKKKVKSALTYPIVVLCLALAIAAFLIIKVVPVFGGIYADFGSALPAPTQFLIDLSDFIRQYWYGVLIGMGLAIYGVMFALRTKKGHEIWNRIQLRLPIVGPLVHKICMSRFSRTFAQLIRSGVPILEVMDITAETSGNWVIEQSIRRVAVDVEKGEHLATAIGKEKVFPPMMVRMVAAGEATGKIDEMLTKIADFWDEEVEATLSALTSLIEPLLIVVIGVIVGGMVIALYLPIFKLGDLVSR
jgi:type IV pilus assembly protein PilC